MNIWNRYKSALSINFGGLSTEGDNVTFWKNLLFFNTILYILPLSMIAYIPGVVFSWINGLMEFVIIDTFSVLLVVVIGFWPNLSLVLRKFLFLCCVYFVAISLLFLLGLTGPGLIYLLAATFFCVILFPIKYSYFPVILNGIICTVVAFLIPMNWLPWSEDPAHNVGQWIAVSSNLVFLSFLSSALIPKVFTGLQESIEKEQKMRMELDRQKTFLEDTLKELKVKNEDLEAFAFSASHDLQEPLRMVTNFLTLLNKRYEEIFDDKAKRYIQFAVEGAKRMRQIILGLLDFSRIGRQEGQMEMVNLNNLMEELNLVFSKTIEEKSARISFSKLPTLYCQRVLVFQVFQNLINNALKYSRDGVKPEIFVTVEEFEGFHKFAFRDNGIGINEEYFDRIFIMFQRLHGKEEFEGSGMGLAIVKRIIERLGGRIWIESREGSGTIFIFTIPQFKESKAINSIPTI